MNIYQRIEAMGIELVYTADLPPHRLGCYVDDEKRIYCRSNLTAPYEAETLHHEAVHAYYRDTSCHPSIEWRAWREAARMIVDPLAYEAAERMSHDSAWIARELGTTRRIVEAYRKAITRGEIRLAA